MISWNQAYKRSVTDNAVKFAIQFGSLLPQDAFRYYAYAVTFPSLLPAQLATGAATPNTGPPAATQAGLGAPTTNLVAGTEETQFLNFEYGAIVLGITAAAIKPQRIANNGAPLAFTYGPSENAGNRDLFRMRLRFAGGDRIIGRNPIPEAASNPNTLVHTREPALVDALWGSGSDDMDLGQELLVTPAQSLEMGISSMVLPDLADGSNIPNPNMSVHLVFHAMVPGRVRMAS